WTEAGAGALSVTAPAQSMRSTQADAGILLTRARGVVQPLLSAVYRRELSDPDTMASLALSGSADSTFIVGGLPLARSTFVGRAGLTVRTGCRELSLMYEWKGAQSQTRHAIRFSLGFE